MLLIDFPAYLGIKNLVNILLGITVTLKGATLSSNYEIAKFLPIRLTEKKSLINFVDNSFTVLFV